VASPPKATIGELWMILQHRKRLLKLMVLNDTSQRELAKVAGYKSHAYLGRLLRGEVTTLDPDAALRIAHHFRVPVEDLFLTRVTMKSGQPAQSKGTAA
jgi:transcriptional regulator with XRE-family HTH domain